MWHTPREERRIVVSTREYRRGIRRTGLFLGGFTSQRWPVVFDVARGAKRIPVAAVGLDLSCSAGEQFSTEDAFGHLDVAKNGKVHESDLIPPDGSDFLGGSHSLTGHLD